MAGKVETVARAICDAAGKTVNKVSCVMCKNGECQMWKEFREEARSAIKAMDSYDKFNISTR